MNLVHKCVKSSRHAHSSDGHSSSLALSHTAHLSHTRTQTHLTPLLGSHGLTGLFPQYTLSPTGTIPNRIVLSWELHLSLTDKSRNNVSIIHKIFLIEVCEALFQVLLAVYSVAARYIKCVSIELSSWLRCGGERPRRCGRRQKLKITPNKIQIMSLPMSSNPVMRKRALLRWLLHSKNGNIILVFISTWEQRLAVGWERHQDDPRANKTC